MSQQDSGESRGLLTLPEVIDKVGLGPTHLRFILTGGGVWFADGSELLLISAVTSSVAAEWSLDSMQRGSMVTIVYIGVFFGNLLSGPISDRHGRKQLIMASYVGIFVFSMLSSFMMSYWSLCFWRFFVGMSFGIGQPPVNVLSSEVTPAKWRVLVNGVSQGLFSLGEVYSCILILMSDPMMQHLNWRQLLQLGAIPSLVFWFAASIFLHQSPYYLARSGQHTEAITVLETMQRDNCLPDFSVDFIDPPVERNSEESVTGQWRKICSGPLFSTTAIMCYTCFVVNLNYYGCLYAFPNLLPALKAAGTNPGSSPAMQLMLGAVWELPGIAMACFFGVCMPRKPILKIYCFLTVLALIIFVNGATGEQGVFKQVAWHLGYYIVKCIVSCGWLIAYIYITEVYPTSIRTTGCSFNIACGRLGSTISPLVYEKLQELSGSYAVFFYMLAGLMFINLLLIDLLPMETFNAPLPTEEEPASERADYGAASEASTAQAATA